MRRERPVGRPRPPLDARLPLVGRSRGSARPRRARPLRSAISAAQYEPGDRGGDRRGRVAVGVLPALLRRRPAPDDALRRPLDVAPGTRVEPPELPREHDRVGDLVELQVRPVRRAVEVGVLREAAVGLLLAVPQVADGALGAGAVAGRELRRRDLVEVARPDEVVGAGVGAEVAPDPRHRRRRDPGAAVRLVLERGHHHHRDVVGRLHAGDAARAPVEAVEVVVPAVGVAPLGVAEAAAQRPLGGAARPRRRRRRSPSASVTSRLPRRPGARDQRGLDDVARFSRRLVGPVHPVVGGEVGPAVARAHVADRGPARRRIARQRARVARRRTRPGPRRGRRRRCWSARGRAARTAGAGWPVSDSNSTSTSTAERAGSAT